MGASTKFRQKVHLSFSFSFFYVLLLVGASGLHHQLSVEGESKVPFFFPFCFVASTCRWAPSLTFNIGSPSFFSFFFFLFCCVWVQVGAIAKF